MFLINVSVVAKERLILSRWKATTASDDYTLYSETSCVYIYIYIYPPPCLLGTSGVFLGHVVCPIPHSGIFLNCFKGPQAGLLIRSRKARLNISDSFFACFFILHFFTFLSQNTPRKGVQKSSKIVKIDKKTLTGSSLEIIPAKNNSKV